MDKWSFFKENLKKKTGVHDLQGLKTDIISYTSEEHGYKIVDVGNT